MAQVIDKIATLLAMLRFVIRDMANSYVFNFLYEDSSLGHLMSVGFSLLDLLMMECLICFSRSGCYSFADI